MRSYSFASIQTTVVVASLNLRPVGVPRRRKFAESLAAGEDGGRYGR